MYTDPEITSAQLQALARAPLLDAEEEKALGVRALAGDVVARNQLVASNVRLAAKIAAAFRGRGLPYTDLIQEGMIGLVRAAERFDPDRGFRFGTYAHHWIRQTIMQALADKARMIRLPYRVVTKMNRVRRIARMLYGSLGRDPTLEELAEAAEVSMDQLADLLPRTIEPRSLEERVSDSDELGSLLPTLDSPPDVLVANGQIVEELRGLLRFLSSRERLVVSLRYGLEDDDPRTLEEVSLHLDVSRERVRQIEMAALDRLRSLAAKLPLQRSMSTRPASFRRGSDLTPLRDVKKRQVVVEVDDVAMEEADDVAEDVAEEAVVVGEAAAGVHGMIDDVTIMVERGDVFVRVDGAIRIVPHAQEVVGRCSSCGDARVVRAGCSRPAHHVCRRRRLEKPAVVG